MSSWIFTIEKLSTLGATRLMNTDRRAKQFVASFHLYKIKKMFAVQYSDYFESITIMIGYRDPSGRKADRLSSAKLQKNCQRHTIFRSGKLGK
jgi:hypothetical protein